MNLVFNGLRSYKQPAFYGSFIFRQHQSLMTVRYLASIFRDDAYVEIMAAQP